MSRPHKEPRTLSDPRSRPYVLSTSISLARAHPLPQLTSLFYVPVSQTSNLKATGVHPTASEGSRKGANEPSAMSNNTQGGESPSLAADVAKNGPSPGKGPYGKGGQQTDGSG